MKAKTIRIDNRIFDVIVKNPFCGLLEITAYEVKNENRKHFGRRKFFEFASSTLFIDDFETIDDAVLHTIKKGFDNEELENNRKRKWDAYEGA